MGTPNTLFNPADIFNLEKDALEALQKFQKTYADYTRCGPNVNPDVKAKYTAQGLTPCSATPATLQNVTTDFDNATAKLTALKTAVDAYKNSKNPPSRDDENATSDASYTTIMQKYQNIQKLRQTLDANLSELYEIGDTKSNFYQRKLMSDSYTKILLTILATSLTVAVFVSMARK